MFNQRLNSRTKSRYYSERCTTTPKSRTRYRSYPECREDGNSILSCGLDSIKRGGEEIAKEFPRALIIEGLILLAKKGAPLIAKGSVAALL